MPLTMSGMSEEVNEVVVTESSEFSYYPSEEIVFDTMLMGKSLDQYNQEAGQLLDYIDQEIFPLTLYQKQFPQKDSMKIQNSLLQLPHLPPRTFHS